jgi:hypothetical protein
VSVTTVQVTEHPWAVEVEQTKQIVQVTEQPWAVEVDETTQTVFVSIPGPVMGGANTSITSLGGITGAIQTPTFIDFATGATVPDATARVTWNDATGTLQVGMTGNVQADIGQTLYAFVHNAEGATINKGQAVYLYQASGNKASIRLAYNTSDAYSAKTLGLAAETIGANQNGMVICQGVLDGIDTSAYAEGATLYLGATAGSLTSTKPSAPNHLVYIGVVERANAGNGQIYVRPQNGYELEELHNVQIVTPANGQTILYDASTGLWKNANLTAGAGITITNGAGSATIAAINSGTVTSVAVSGGSTGLTTSGGPITGAGTITIAGTLAVASGGTGATDAATARSNLSAAGSGAVTASGITMSSARLLGRTTASTGAVEEITVGSGLTFTGGTLAATGGSGTVTSIDVSGGTTGLTTSGGPITGAGTITLAGTLAVTNGGTGATTQSGARTALGVPATDGTGASGTWSISVSGNAGTVTNGVYTSGSYADPSWITSLSGTKVSGNISGNATNVTGIVAVANGGTGAATLTGIVKGNGTSAFTAASAGTDYLAPFGSQTQAYVYAAPSGSAGVPSFRALVASDIPTLNQNTTGTASNVTGTVAIANGGSGQTSAQAAINAFAGAVTSGQYLRGNGTNVVMAAIQAADVPTLNQNTTGTAANVTGTVAVANGGTGATDAATARSNLTAQKTITSGTAAPTGGSDGDIYLQYT